MDPQWIPIVSAGLGAAAGVAGGAIVSGSNALYAQRHWLRDKRSVLGEEYFAALTQGIEATSPARIGHDNSKNLDVHDRLIDAAAKLALYASPKLFVQTDLTAQAFLLWVWKKDMREQNPDSNGDPEEYREAFLHLARGLRLTIRHELHVDRRKWRQRVVDALKLRRARLRVALLSKSDRSQKTPA